MNWFNTQLWATAEIILGRNNRLGHGVDKGLSRLDTSNTAFKLSFIAVLAGLLLELTIMDIVFLTRAGEEGRLLNAFGFFVAFICAYCTPLFILTLICSRPPFKDRFVAVVTVTNWANLIFTVVFWPATLFLLLLPHDSAMRVPLSVFFLGLTFFLLLGMARIMRATMLIRLGYAVGLCIALYLASAFVYEGVLGALGVLDV